MRKLLLLALLPTLAFGQVLVEGKAEATVSTSGTSAVSGALSLGWKFVQCSALTHYRLGSDTTATATTTDMTIPAAMAWPVLITQDLRRIAFILDSSTGSCSIYPSNATAWNSMRYRWPSIDGTAIAPASLTVSGATDLAGTLKADSIQTHTGGGTAALLYTTGTGQFTIGNTSNGVLGCFGNVCQITNAAFAVSSTLQTASASTNGLTVTGATASNPVTAAFTGTNSGVNWTTTGSGVFQLNGANLPKGPADVYFDAYDSISTVSTGAMQQGGATATAMTVQACNYTVLTAAVGTGTETMELCSSTGITTGNCTGTKYCTCAITSGNTARTVVSCTVNTAAIAAGVTPTWVETADTIATSDAIGNMSAHFTSP